jgi:hypothetical protein
MQVSDQAPAWEALPNYLFYFGSPETEGAGLEIVQSNQ